jgi:hypothetical protein
VWLPEVEKMFAQIILDCQTQKENVSCEYCIVKENCHLRLKLDRKTETVEMAVSPSMLVPILLVRV